MTYYLTSFIKCCSFLSIIFLLTATPVTAKEYAKNSVEAALFSNSVDVGDMAPSFSLRDTFGNTISSAAIQQKGFHIVLVFYRGHWDDYCNNQLRRMQQDLVEIENKGALVVAVSPQTDEATKATIDKNILSYHVLHDPSNSLAKKFGISWKIDKDMRDVYKKKGIDLDNYYNKSLNSLPAPSTFVIDHKGKVHFASKSADYRKRTGSGKILEILETMKH